MPDLLVRNVDAGLKRRIEQSAHGNGRSLQAELLNALEQQFPENADTYVSVLRKARAELGGDTGFVLPERRPSRSAVDFV